MTYSAGSLIEDVDYNGFANNTAGANVNDIWGTGSGDFGYGQGTTLATVSDGTLITATQWANLNNRISSIANHTGTTITSRANPVVGDTIGILSALNTDLTNCTVNRGYAVSSGTISSTWSGSTAKTSNTGSGQSAWTITFTHTVTFGSSDQARYFFNAGGLIRLDMSKTSPGFDADPDWNNFVSTVGALVLSGRVASTNQVIAGVSYSGFTRIGGSGTPAPFSSTTGWFQLAPGAAPTTMFQLNNTGGGYGGNYIQVTAQKNAGSTAITFVTSWVSVGTSTPGSTANITGGSDTTSPYLSFGSAPAVLCRFIPPSTTFLTSTWGTPTVAASVV
jgi:hypothetical protein